MGRVTENIGHEHDVEHWTYLQVKTSNRGPENGRSLYSLAVKVYMQRIENAVD